MSSNGISIKEAMAKWHLTSSQAEQLDKMDDDHDNGTKGNGRISGNVFDMAKTYYEETHNKENNNESNRPQLFNNLITWIKETKEMMEMMKNGNFDADENEEAEEVPKSDNSNVSE